MKMKYALHAMLLVLSAIATRTWADNLRAEMEAANTEWLTAYNTLNSAAFPAMYTKDAYLLPAGTQPVIGAEAIDNSGATGSRVGS